MTEGILTVETAERIPYSPVQVTYEGNIDPVSPPLKIDGTLLSQAIQESNYPPSIAKPIAITNGPTAIQGELAHFDTLRSRMVLNQDSIMETLRHIRQMEHGYLDSIQTNPSRLKRFIKSAGRLLNPITAPYELLAIRGRGQHVFSGSAARSLHYLDAAKEGFEVNRNGQLVKLSKEESITRAKDFMDRLLERAAPGIIGWVIAHEYEHRHNVKRKTALKVGSLLAPFLGGVTLASTLSSPEVIVGGLLLGMVGATLGRRADEKSSYDAGDKNFSRFAKAITINHDFFQKEVLGKTIQTSSGS